MTAQVGVRRPVRPAIDARRIEEANANAKSQNVAGKVRFVNQDLFTADIRDASVVTLYLLNILPPL